MDRKDQRFELLMTREERHALAELASRKGISQANVIRSMIRRAARRLK